MRQFAHAHNGGQRGAHVVAQVAHEGAFHAACFFCQPAPVGEVECDAADGENPRNGQQAIKQAHIVQLPVEAFLKSRGILAYAYAAHYFANFFTCVAAQAALLGHKHAEQPQALSAGLLGRRKHFWSFFSAARKCRTLPNVCHVFWPQRRAADNADAHTLTRAALCQLAAHVRRVYQNKRSAILRCDGSFRFRQPGIGLPVITLCNIYTAVCGIPVSGVH